MHFPFRQCVAITIALLSAIQAYGSSPDSVQRVVYYADTSLINVFSGALVIHPIASSSPVTDTVRIVKPDSAALRSVIKTGISVAFDTGQSGPPFYLGLRYVPLATGFHASQVWVYRIKGGKLLAFDSVVVDSGRGIAWAYIDPAHADDSVLQLPILALIDTLHPQAVFADTHSVVESGSDLFSQATVRDNVANVKVWFCYGPGGGAPATVRAHALADTFAVIRDTVPSAVINTESGLRAYLVLKDGVHRDSINISRQVHKSAYPDLSTEGGIWTPVRVTATLDSPAVERLLGLFLDNGAAWRYDQSRFRLFRWNPPKSNLPGLDGWQEFTDSTAADFRLEPGNVLWLKTSTTRQAIDYKGATTLSLKDTFSIQLTPQEWFDFALPYRMIMKIGDIFDATGNNAPKKLLFFKWKQNLGRRYYTEALYIDSIPGENYHTIQLSSEATDGYSVYNTGLTPVTMRIPPTPAVISHVTAKARSDAVPGSWVLKIVTDESAPVMVGCLPAMTRDPVTYYPVSPSFVQQGVMVYDRSTQRMFGHAIAHRSQNGGYSWNLRFFNYSDRSATISWHIDGMNEIPDGMHAYLIDPTTGTASGTLNKPQKMVLEPGSGENRILAVGTMGYAQMVKKKLGPSDIAILSISRILSNGAVVIKFSVPYEGVNRLKIRMIHLDGKQIWMHEIHQPEAGVHRILLDLDQGSTRLFSSGPCVIQLSVDCGSGKPFITKQFFSFVH